MWLYTNEKSWITKSSNRKEILFEKPKNNKSLNLSHGNETNKHTHKKLFNWMNKKTKNI